MKANTQKGIVHLVVPIVIIILLAVTAFVLFRVGVIKTKKEGSLTYTTSTGEKGTIEMKSEYENPFDEKASYSNPFEDKKNPFDYLNE